MDDNFKLLYLKDWHFFRHFPNESIYKTPFYFSSDWLNEMYDEKMPCFDDDFKFVYIGVKDTWTPFHCDVYKSYSWSANISGKKRWIFVKPGFENEFKDKYGNFLFDIRSKLNENKDNVIEIVQESGQVIFVPTGWYHQVHNLEDTISINHNWINAFNIGKVWNFLKKNIVMWKMKFLTAKLP